MCVTLGAATLPGSVSSSATHGRRAIPLQHPMHLFIKRLPKFPGGNNDNVKKEALVSLMAWRLVQKGTSVESPCPLRVSHAYLILV